MTAPGNATLVTHAPSPLPRGERFLFVDALRGIAALMVVFHHLLHSTVLEVTLRKILPVWFCEICTFGEKGVQIFFVISGFVIAHSIRRTEPNLAGAGNFILRRQLRLDPPYWAALALVLLTNWLQRKVPSFTSPALPSPKGLLLNAVYLQNLTNTPQILNVAWTLCLEIQFYLVFIILILLGSIGSRSRESRQIRPLTIGLVIAVALVSLPFCGGRHLFGATFVPFWCYFASGVLCYWVFTKIIPEYVFLSFVLLFALSAGWQLSTHMLVGLATMLALYAAVKTGHLCDWLSNRPIQYLGRISYSFYLTHLTILSAIMRGGYKLTHENRWAALGWFVLALVASVGVADLFHRLIEAPSMRLTARLRRKSPRAADPALAAPAGDRVEPAALTNQACAAAS
jgi:peptidoglycan/LPS O-acetylase OafA/YrhL